MKVEVQEAMPPAGAWGSAPKPFPKRLVRVSDFSDAGKIATKKGDTHRVPPLCYVVGKNRWGSTPNPARAIGP